MQILTGAYNHTVDAKNRIRIPSKLRDDLLEDKSVAEGDENVQKKYSLVFHRGTDNCIEVYTQEGLNEIYAPFRDIKHSDTARYSALRQYMTSFETVESDPQGRFVIPSKFKQYASINKDIVICGNVDHIEIWAKEVYDEYFNEGNLDINELVKILGN